MIVLGVVVNFDLIGAGLLFMYEVAEAEGISVEL